MLLGIYVAGDWVYYTNLKDGGKLYKMRTDGTEITKLNDDASIEINVVGDWIYYLNDSDYQLCKMRTDGTEKTKLNDDVACNINVVGDWIYYLNNSYNARFSHEFLPPFGFKIFKMRTDGTERTKLSDDKSSYMNIEGGWIYYSNSSDEGKLYKMRTDGTERTKLNDHNSCCINIAGDWIYYLNSREDYQLYKMRTDGTERQIVD